jgi:HAD superfamily hydrolase (TIGR01509 family)
LAAALVDVGGTLWPNSWPLRETDGEARVHRVAALLPDAPPDVARAAVAAIVNESKFTEGGTGDSKERQLADEAEVVISRCLRRHGLAADDTLVRQVRRAMALPVVDRFAPLPGAIELLAHIRAWGLKCVIASNTYWRDASCYLDDFKAMGMADNIDAIITSVDAGHPKPHPAVFELAMRTAGTTADRCVVIGNKESNDIEPALSLGMRTILVYPDDVAPVKSRADAVAPDLWQCADALRVMLGPP